MSDQARAELLAATVAAAVAGGEPAAAMLTVVDGIALRCTHVESGLFLWEASANECVARSVHPGPLVPRGVDRAVRVAGVLWARRCRGVELVDVGGDVVATATVTE